MTFPVLPPLPPILAARIEGASSALRPRAAWSARTGVALACVLLASVAVAQVQSPAGKPSVVELLVKWTPLLAQGFLFNLAISVLAMLVSAPSTSA